MESTSPIENQISVISYGTADTKIGSGRTAPGETNWKVWNKGIIYVDVDTSAAGFTNTPVYVVSIGGISQHWKTTGGNAPYQVTAKGFRLYVKWDRISAALEPLTSQMANGNQWHINWIAFEPSTPPVKQDQISVTSGTDNTKIAWAKTIPTTTNWQVAGGNTVYVDVDTSAAGFTNTPLYVTSMAALGYNEVVAGASSVYEATATGFRIYIKWDTTSQAETALTPSTANSYSWHIHWIALEPSTKKTSP